MSMSDDADAEMAGDLAAEAELAAELEAEREAEREAYVRGERALGFSPVNLEDESVAGDGASTLDGASNAPAHGEATNHDALPQDFAYENYMAENMFARAGSVAGGSDYSADIADMPHNQGGGRAPAGAVPADAECHIRQMPGFCELNGAALLGAQVKMKAPLFRQGCSNTSGWMMYSQSGISDGSLVPVRAMCFNIPAECFSLDASQFRDWVTPMENSIRAASIAAILGLVSTPLSKGWLSGSHEEVLRAQDQTEGEQREGGAEIKKPKRVHHYMFQSPSDEHINLPMVVIGYEDIYDRARKTVVAIRVWHFVFDKTHSTSELARKLMNESADESDHSGAAHCPNNQRSDKVVKAAKATRQLIGASLESAQLELAAGMCYRHVLNESIYKNLLGHYAGHNDKSPGLPPVDLAELPAGVLNQKLSSGTDLGSVHPLGFEWVFNAKRPDALKAGLVKLDGTLMDVDPEQVTVTSYFNISVPAVAKDTHAFRVPDWVGNNANGGKGCFFFQTDPKQVNIFDMVLPHAIAGAIKPGPQLMSLYKERFGSDIRLSIDSPQLISRFNNTMTGRDQWILSQINAIQDSIVNFDTVDTTADQRMDAKTAKKAAARGIASYGQMDGDSFVVEPRQVLKEHAFTTSNVHSKLISPWAAEQKANLADEEMKLRTLDDGEHETTDISDPVFAELRQRKAAFEKRFTSCMRELVTLHLAKMQRSFTSRIDKESIPAGYRAVWDGLQLELASMPNHTANVAFAENNQLTDSDRTVFGHSTNWLGTFFEDDCFVDGRDWRLMQELFYHCFEQFGEQTLLLIFCGPKGNGKTLRTERAMRAFPKHWITMSGPSSAKAGMQGNSDSSNGSNCIYDEMIDELTDGDGSNRTEYWKQILMKREYNYNKAVVVKGQDGREMHRTFKLKTPHQETHCVCTNRGPAFTKGQEDPTEVKSALIDRAVVNFVRTLGSKTHDDQEFEDHLSDRDVARKLRMFRIKVCLMGMLKMLIFRQPYLKPDTAFAQKLWDKWDELLDRKYGLPKPSPRKNIKRLENLITMCCQNAVCHVFMFKQTACNFEAGQRTEEYPNGKPFELSMLWECVQLLQPTREMIHFAWCMGLEYNIGTSAMGLNTMTIVAEVCGFKPGDMFRKPPTDDIVGYVVEDSELTELAADAEATRQRTASASGVSGGASLGSANRLFRASGASDKRLPEFDKILNSPNSYMTVEDIKFKKSQLAARREARAEYQYRCSRSELQNAPFKDAQAILDASGIAEVIGSLSLAPRPASLADASSAVDNDVAMDNGPHRECRSQSPTDCDNLSGEEIGRRMYENGEDDTGLSPGDPALYAFHCARAKDWPGTLNCAFIHSPTPEHQRKCPYCRTTLAETEGLARGAENAHEAETHLSLAASLVWPDTLEAGMFYKAQTIVQLACGKAAYVGGEGTPSVLGTRACGTSVGYKKRSNSHTGAQQYDTAWYQGKGEHWKSWHRSAEYIRLYEPKTVMQFDMHVDGLRDCLYLCSTRDNARRLPEEPRLVGNKRHERCFVTMNGTMVNDDTVCVRTAPYSLPGSQANVTVDHQHLPRHPDAGFEDTMLQRRMDSLLHGGRLSALNILVSNKITSMPPIRMHSEGIEFNVGAVHAHILLVAEAVLECALVPGLKNMQEKFCNNQPGPEGLSGRTHEKKASGHKRTSDGLPTESVHTLPYSYDVVSVALGIKTGEMLYDDMGTGKAHYTTCKYSGRYNLSVEFEQLPQLSLRYIGYEEANRQTISIKLQASKPAGQAYCEAGDPTKDRAQISKAHVCRSLGRAVSDEDHLKYIGRRQGARAMGGVTGDLFASSTWYRHTIVTLRERGLLCGSGDEAVVKTFADMEQCLFPRVFEHVCKLKGSECENMNLFCATSQTYSAVEKRRVEEAAQPCPEERKIARQIDELWFNPMELDILPPVPAAASARIDGDIRLGVGPQKDV